MKRFLEILTFVIVALLILAMPAYTTEAFRGNCILAGVLGALLGLYSVKVFGD